MSPAGKAARVREMQAGVRMRYGEGRPHVVAMVCDPPMNKDPFQTPV